MKFQMNGVEYTIKEVDQKDLWKHKIDEQDGYYYGQTHFQTQEVWLDKALSKSKKKKTLYHELTHVYIREYLTSRDIEPDEEVLCDICANSHDIIHKIVVDYFKHNTSKINKKQKLAFYKAYVDTLERMVYYLYKCNELSTGNFYNLMRIVEKFEKLDGGKQ